MDASDALLLVVDWDSAPALLAAVEEGEILELSSEAAAWGYSVSPLQILSPSFDRQLTREAGVATLLRVAATDAPRVEAPARDSSLALQAVAAPGSTRIYGAASDDGRTSVCRIDFDSEDGLWHFLESPLRERWALASAAGLEAETWALNLPRLRCSPAASPVPSVTPPPEGPTKLSVQLSVSDDGRSARIRLQGRVDPHSSELSEKSCHALISDGCLRLEIDVSGLTSISAEVLGMLVRTARSLKQRGGQFILIDRAERVKRVTRWKHLEASVSKPAGAPKRALPGG